MTKTKAKYGALRPCPVPGATGPPPWQELHTDVRHRIDETPNSWLRYFFPQDFDVRNGAEQGPYLQYFDVLPQQPLQDDSAASPPPFAPNAYLRLSWVQQQLDPEKAVDVPGRTREASSPILAALDITGGKDAQIYREGAEAHLQQVLDALPLADLLRGMLLYMIEQTEAGVQLARQYALRDALVAQEDHRKMVREQAAAELVAMRAAWDAEAAAQHSSLKEVLRKQVGEELTSQLRSATEERERLTMRLDAAENTIKRLTENEATLERRAAAVEAELQHDREESIRMLAAAEQRLTIATTELTRQQDALLAARKAMLAAVRARSKTQVMDAAMAVLVTGMPGVAGYIAELQPSADLGGPDGSAALALVRQAADAEGTDGPLAQSLATLTPELLRSPLSAGVINATGAGLSVESIDYQMRLKYVKATHGQAFMVGQVLDPQHGASWAAVRSGQVLYVPEVTDDVSIHFFRANANPAAGAYLAVPIRGINGEVVGLLGVDTVVHKGGNTAKALDLGEEDAQFVQELADLVSAAVAEEQQQLASLLDNALSTTETGLAGSDTVAADPELYADLSGGQQLLQSALQTLRGLTDLDLQDFAAGARVNDLTHAVLVAVLKASGVELTSDALDWATLRTLITRSMVQQVSGLDPGAAWADWLALGKSLQPVLKVEADTGSKLEDALGLSSSAPAAGEPPLKLEGRVGTALGRWLTAVRQVSAARELQRVAQERLKRANAVLLKQLADKASPGSNGRGSTNALQELRSYRVPPKYTFSVLQGVLQLTGHSDDDCSNWGRMKVLTTSRLITRLTELKPTDVPKKVTSTLRRGTRDVDEADVRKESAAALALFRWLHHFLACGDLLARAA